MKLSKKKAKRLEARVKGYFETMSRPENRTKNMTGYKKPGSFNK